MGKDAGCQPGCPELGKGEHRLPPVPYTEKAASTAGPGAGSGTPCLPVYTIPFISTDMLILLLPLALVRLPAESWRLSEAAGQESRHSGQRYTSLGSGLLPVCFLYRTVLKFLMGLFYLFICYLFFYDPVIMM